jgi:uncharacterized lipoprotein YddW (UPF0748 family)
MREFRAAWVATVWNLDWPSRPGLAPEDLRAEMDRLLDVAAETRLNAILFQIRPEADAVYASKLEPWSYWLSGKQGQGPRGGFDPLAYAVAAAHQRGLELHAWFNPFRARASEKVSPAPSHALRRHPEWTLAAGSQVWLNPALPEVRDRAIEVVTDVVRRYDVDGVHLDDYFYPYPQGGRLVFDDSASYRAYRERGGKSDVEAWRRSQVDAFVRDLGRAVKRVRPEAKYGISPFGIWRPGVPETIEAGIDGYRHLAADSRTWFREGWVDYLMPQLYWRIDQREQSFRTLVRWWAGENRSGRHLWPGVATSRIHGEGSDRSRGAGEILAQIEETRRQAANRAGSGHAHWSAKALLQDRDGVRGKLKAGPYREVAVVPESSWMGSGGKLAPPVPVVLPGAEGVVLEWRADEGRKSAEARWWVVQVQDREGGPWRTSRVLPAGITGLRFQGEPAAFAVRGMDGAGRLSGAGGVARVRAR